MPVGSIEAQVQRLDTECDRLIETIERARNVFAPVLKSPGPTTENPPINERYESGMAERLSVYTTKCELGRYMLQDMIERCDI